MLPLVIEILADPRLSQPDLCNPLYKACNHGHLGVVKELLAFPNGVITNISNMTSFDIATIMGHIEIFKVLLADTRFDPSICYSVLNLAMEHRNLEIIKLLLEDGRVDPSVNDSSILVRAVLCGSIPIVRAILEDGRVDPAARNNLPMRTAIKMSGLPIEQLLRQHIGETQT